MKFKKGETRKEEIVDLDHSFHIDGEDLNKEWLKQSATIWEFIKKAAKLSDKKRDIQRQIDVEFADLSLKIRKKPSKYAEGLKLTEGVVDAVIDVDEDYNILLNKLHSVEYDLDLYQGAIRAMEHKKKALEYLSQTEIVKHYSEPSETAVENKVRKMLRKEKR